ncbi:YXWGXW repeat-containing protein [bacterium]|nr:YXWGXW repeat-containing protein [candidate division CSSED10-310 bacterium]
MNMFQMLRRGMILSFWIGVCSGLISGISPEVNGQASVDDGMQILTRGQIHEAFANVSVDENQPGFVINRRVPDPIPEIPPDYRPDGDNVEWISGYWSWDDEQNDFIWISGVWRDVPPDRQWVPGYWTEVEGGNLYVSGFWAEAEQPDMVYLPPPPDSKEAGPSSPPAGINQIWMPGSWVWYQNQYQWQPGYWVTDMPELVWIPAHYVWTPAGCIFVGGYWDYQLVRRGVMFAPVYYPRPTYSHAGYYYTPTITLDIDSLFFALFIQMHSHHYYFGDYYDARYESRGYHPWWSEHATRYGYDPYYRNYRSRRQREDQGWEHRLHVQYDYRRQHEDARPPHTYAMQKNFNQQSPANRANVLIGKRFADVVADNKQPIRFTRLDKNHQNEFQTRARELNTFQGKRKKLEVADIVNGKPQKASEIKKPLKKELSISPISSKPGKKLEQPQGNPQGKPMDQPQGKPQGKPQIKPKDQEQNELQGKPQGNPQAKPMDQPQGKPQGKPQIKPKVEKGEINPNATPSPAPDVKKNEERLSH